MTTRSWAEPYKIKGNINLDKLRRLIDEVGAERIPYLSLETNVNMAGGQPGVAAPSATITLNHKPVDKALRVVLGVQARQWLAIAAW